MPLFGRPDGTLVADAPLLRRFMPFLMQRRNESAVFLEQEVALKETLQFLERRNAGRGRRFTFFHVVLCALIRTLAERPILNRFVVGKRLYQRRDIALSFAVKKRFEDDAPLTTVKVVFSPGDGLEEVARRIDEAIGEGRGEKKTRSEGEMGLVMKLPRSLLAFAMWLQRVADHFNLLPAAMITPDPLYASAFIANLGSVGIEAPFHHLYEYGTVPLFLAIGRIRKGLIAHDDASVDVTELVTLRYTLDERIADGFYCARSLELFKGYLEDPDTLEPAGKGSPVATQGMASA